MNIDSILNYLFSKGDYLCNDCLFKIAKIIGDFSNKKYFDLFQNNTLNNIEWNNNQLKLMNFEKNYYHNKFINLDKENIELKDSLNNYKYVFEKLTPFINNLKNENKYFRFEFYKKNNYEKLYNNELNFNNYLKNINYELFKKINLFKEAINNVLNLSNKNKLSENYINIILNFVKNINYPKIDNNEIIEENLEDLYINYSKNYCKNIEDYIRTIRNRDAEEEEIEDL